MAYFYPNSSHSSLEISNTTLPPEEINNEPWCFNATALEAVPWPLGQWFLISLYSLTSLVALIGNLTVIVVELVGKESAQNIRKYLINLAVSDIIIGVLCVPFSYTDFMLGQWIFPHWLCPTAQYVQLLSVFVTSLTLTIIGVERYMATLHPFSRLHRWLECHTHIMLILTWILGAFYAYIPIGNTATRAFQLNEVEYYECSYVIGTSAFRRRLFMTSNFVLTFLLPLSVLICSYSAIMRKLMCDRTKSIKLSNQHHYQGHKICNQKQSLNSNVEQNYVTVVQGSAGLDIEIVALTDCRQQGQQVPTVATNAAGPNQQNNNSNNNSQFTSQQLRTSATTSSSSIDLRKSVPPNHHSKPIKMMFTVIVVYGICWMPIKLYQFLFEYGLISYCTESQLYALVTLYFTCHWMAMANSFVNPIIYSFMSKSFRNDFRKINQALRKTLSNSQISFKTTSTHV